MHEMLGHFIEVFFTKVAPILLLMIVLAFIIIKFNNGEAQKWIESILSDGSQQL